ncbi:MAG: shikimate kinase [Actinomycetota bacterium]
MASATRSVGTWDCQTQHIVLVGMMGAGKSAVGRLLAERLGRPLHDSDQMIEEREGRTVREIWAADGEAHFRRLETEVLAEGVTAESPSIIAAAGGVVLSDENRRVLKESDAHVVWLLADVDLLVERVKHGKHRPLLDDDPEGTLRTMFETREALYRDVADAIVSVEHRSVNDVAGAVLRCCA